jgi:hypothetical protein
MMRWMGLVGILGLVGVACGHDNESRARSPSQMTPASGVQSPSDQNYGQPGTSNTPAAEPGGSTMPTSGSDTTGTSQGSMSPGSTTEGSTMGSGSSDRGEGPMAGGTGGSGAGGRGGAGARGSTGP